MFQNLRIITCLTVLLNTIFFSNLNAQNNNVNWDKIILKKDSVFWISFNNCYIDDYDNFFTNDIEFYHDAGGITVGLENLKLSTKKNICSGQFKLRRAAVKNSYKIYPLKNGNEIYGAILSGEHLFFKEVLGQKEKPEGLAKFTHLWIFKDNDWKMSRVLSYDHGPAPAIDKIGGPTK